MKAKIKIEQEVEITHLHVDAGVRYWEDATVDGKEDTEGSLIPCRVGDRWQPVIDIDAERIINWRQGVTADVHYKVCDDGIYILTDKTGKEVLRREGYVPDDLIPGEYGDYIVMKIGKDGQILDWYESPSIAQFLEN